MGEVAWLDLGTRQECFGELVEREYCSQMMASRRTAELPWEKGWSWLRRAMALGMTRQRKDRERQDTEQ